jgi:hypothetical protein
MPRKIYWLLWAIVAPPTAAWLASVGWGPKVARVFGDFGFLISFFIPYLSILWVAAEVEKRIYGDARSRVSLWLASLLLPLSRPHDEDKRAKEQEAEQRRRQQEQDAERRQWKREQAQLSDWWGVLGVSPKAERDEIVRVYHQKIRQNHPDRVFGLAPEFRELAEKRTKALNEAYSQAMRACDQPHRRGGEGRK